MSLALAACCPTLTYANDIRVLIVDGFSNHSVEKTTQKIQDILASDPAFKVSVSTMPEFNSEAWKTWKPNFAANDVIIQTCNNINKSEIAWPDDVKAELATYIRNGGGMYVYHSANNAFADWPEYNKMIGMGWRFADFGKALQVKDGQLLEIPAGVGNKTSHGPRIDAVFHQFGEHPIHANLPQSWMSTDVEVYSYTRGPLENLTVLSYAREPVNDMDFPTEWVVEYGAGRVYTSTYGHYWKNQENPPGVRDVAFQTLTMRALQWLAKKPVNQSVPDNFPTATSVSLQDVPPRIGANSKNAATGASNNETSEPRVEGPGAIDLLAGGSLDAWDVPSDHWQLDNGSIVASTKGEKLDLPEWIYTKRSFGDFEFTCELKLSGDDRRNTGIYYRAKIFRFDGYKTFDAPAGYEMDAGKPRPNKNNYWGSLGDWYSRPKLRIFAEQQALKQAYKPDDWNRMTIRARGNRLEYWINGIKVMDFRDPDPNGSAEGAIGFQIHDKTDMKAEFRKIRVHSLSD